MKKIVSSKPQLLFQQQPKDNLCVLRGSKSVTAEIDFNTGNSASILVKIRM